MRSVDGVKYREIRNPQAVLANSSYSINLLKEDAMWTKPEYTEMRFGFEVTMYIYNR